MWFVYDHHLMVENQLKSTIFFSSHELLDVSQDLTTACSILSPDVGLQNNNWCISQSGLRLRVFDLQVLQIWPGVESYRLWNMRCATDLGWSCVWFNPRNLQSPADDPFTLRMNPGAAPKKKKNLAISTLQTLQQCSVTAPLSKPEEKWTSLYLQTVKLAI